MKEERAIKIKTQDNLSRGKSFILILWIAIILQITITSLSRLHYTADSSQGLGRRSDGASAGLFDVMFAEAGKKKKKEKSEVVVISVQNSPAKGGMYPIFVPSCGGHGGYGRRKRSISYI